MQVAIIDAPQSATGTDAETNLTDRKTLHSFIFKNMAELTDLAHEAGKSTLFFGTPDAIIGMLFRNLHRYGGPPVEADFMVWARRFVSREASRYEITARILAEYKDLIHKAIHESMWTSAIDLAVEHQDVYWEVVFLIFQRAHSLDRKGTAKLSTRLYELVKKHVYQYHNKKNDQRRKSVQRRWNEIGCERFSDDELAAMRAAEADEGVYDPGYSEAGLSLA